MKLGKLKRLDLRSYWQHEALNFTTWLAEAQNLEELSDEIGIGIEVIQTEANIGRFHVDILAQEENTGRKIIIENQLELTDHSHLGQLITYAAGIEAEYIIWIVRDVREEHTQAIDWLNEHTDEKLNFFLVRVELWQIEESSPAPKFTVICRPNDWAKSVRESTNDVSLSDTKTMQLEFWQRLREYATEMKSELKLRSPRPQHWYDISIGSADYHLALTTNTVDGAVGCEFYIPASKELFQTLLGHKAEIEKELQLQETLDWQELPGKKASRIRVLHPFDFEKQDRKEGFEWLIKTATKFKKAFPKYSNGQGLQRPPA